MRAWLKNLWSATRDSLWFLPAVLTIGAAGLAAGLMVIERQGLLWSSADQAPWWVYQGDGDGARVVLNTVAAGLVTVTGVVFSVTIVAVQLASSQYTPRVLRNFSADRGNQMVLGIFIATFTFAMIVLRTVRTEGGGTDAFVPRLAVSVAMALAIISVAALIYFINHMAREIQVTAILERIAKETTANVHKLFPEHIGRADPEPRADPRRPEHESLPVCADRAGYIQLVDDQSLFEIGDKARIVMEPKIGAFVLQGRPLASVWTPGPLTPRLEKEIRKAIVLGPERSPQQDIEFGILQISDVAIKALSPSVNDPTTAIRCIDRLAEILTELGTRNPPESRRTKDGRISFIASYTTFEDGVRVAFDGIRHFGAGIPAVAEHLLRTLSEMIAQVPRSRQEPLVAQARAVYETARQRIDNDRDRADVERMMARFADRAGIEFAPATPQGDGTGVGEHGRSRQPPRTAV